MLLTSSSLSAGQQEQPRLRQSPGMQPSHTTPHHPHHASSHRNYHSPAHSSQSSLSSSSTSPRRHHHRQEENAITLEEYEEVLGAEVWVEVAKLREYARHGIPREVRGVSRPLSLAPLLTLCVTWGLLGVTVSPSSVTLQISLEDDVSLDSR